MSVSRKSPIKFVLLIWLFTCVLTVNEARTQFRFDSWTSDNGLPQVSVNSILQTRDGFLWLTTFGGLVRYDGIKFQVFNTGNTKGLKTSRFLQLYEDRAGTLWIGTEGQGVTRYKDGQFETFTTEDGRLNQLTRISEDSTGNLLFKCGTAADIIMLRWTGDGFAPYTPADGAPIDNIKIAFQTPYGGVWYLENQRLKKFENGRITVDYKPDFQPRLFFEDSQGRGWIAGWERVLYMLKDNRLTTFSEKDGFPPLAAQTIFEDKQGRVWVGTSGGGLIVFDGEKFTQYTSADGLVGNQVLTVYQDREGTIWVGTTAGLSRLTARTVTAYSIADGLAADNVYPIYQDKSGKIWIGSWAGLSVYENGRFENVSERYGVTGALIMSFLEDRDGGFWIGSWDDNVRRVKNGQITVYSLGQINTKVRAIVEDKDGSVWFGATNGLVRFRDGHLTKFTSREGLGGKAVFAIYEDRRGRLWIGTDAGLTVYHNGAFRQFGEAEGFAGGNVRSIIEDADGALWIGMYDSGLYRYKDEKFTRLTTAEGLFDNGAFQILDDAAGNFWISCNLGIYRVRQSELNDYADGRITKITSVPYNKRDGMLSSECNGGASPAGIRARDGRLWFPTQKGVAVIDPAKIPFNSQPPPVVISSFLVDAKAVDARQPVTIQPGQAYLEINYSGLSFINPELVKFKYKLEGLDHEWTDADTRRTAFYTHLPPGKYVFRVLAANRDNVWNEQGASIEITVLPPFWRTWWFVSVSALTLGALAFAFYRRRINHLKRAHAAQETFSRRLIESQETERTRIAKELHDGLGQSLVLIRNWALLGIKAEDVKKTNLNVISDTASEAINEVREIAYNLGPYQLDRLGLKLTIEEMIQKVSQATPIQFETEIGDIDRRFSKDAEINIFRIVQESVNNIVKHSAAQHAKIEIKVDGSKISLKIADDGKGFAAESNGRRGFGLSGIKERVNLLKGELSIKSEPDRGTRIEIILPLVESNNGR